MEKTKFVLYLANGSPTSRRAARTIDERLKQAWAGDCEVEIVDVTTDPARAESAGIVATPTLVRVSPPPQRRVVGDLADWERVIAALEVD